MTANELCGHILESHAKYSNDDYMQFLGKEMFRMYTEMGLPPDMFISEIKKKVHLDQLAVIFIVSTYQGLFLEHRRMSGIDDKRVNKIQRKNNEDIIRLIKTGELGVY